MRVKFIAGVTAVAAIAAIAFYVNKEENKTETSILEQERKERKAKQARFVEARALYEFNMVKDPVTGKIPEGIREKEIAFARTLPVKGFDRNGRLMNPAAMNNYLPAGPNNIGGRTRAVAYDVRYGTGTNKVIIAGCVSGGIMRSEDGGNTWQLVTPSENIHSLTTLAQDPRPGQQDTWYAGTGEFIGNSASSIDAFYAGYGIWKSVNNGLTWTHITVPVSPFTTNNLHGFDHAADLTYSLKVNPVNGHLYIAMLGTIVKSTDNGNSFYNVFQSYSGQSFPSSATGQIDIAITNTGKVILGVNGGAPDPAKRGVWVSNTGEANSWSRIAGGTTTGVDAVTGWRGNTTTTSSRRIVLALAPSNQNLLYAFYQNGLSSDNGNPEADLFLCDMSNNTYVWSNRSSNMPDFPGGNLSGSDPLTVQGGYDMEVAVHPTNPDIVFVGGTNLYRSTNGFTSTANTSWIGGYRSDFTYGQYVNSHADIHRLVFNPSNANEAICGNDGGVQSTSNILASTVAWTMLPNYQTLQYYTVAIDPVEGRNNFAGGSQDNGVRFRDKTGRLNTPVGDSNNHRVLFTADGATVAFSTESSGSQYLYESIQYGDLRRVTLIGGGFQTSGNISPTGLTGDQDAFGEFVTNFRLVADNTEDLYYINYNRMFRTRNASTVTQSSGWEELTGVSSAVNPGNPAGSNISIRGTANSRGPYLTTHALYFGTTNGKIFRLDDPRNAATNKVPVNITPTGLSGNVQDISVNPNDDNEIMAVVSNYNVVSIWHTKNAKSQTPTWVSIEGNLTLPSIRSCMIVVKKNASNTPVTEYYVGTSIGLYSTTNLDGNFTEWVREGGSTLNYAVVQSLAYRPIDNVLLVGTHGNGMYYTFLGSPNYTPNVGTGINPIINDKNFIQTVYPTTTNSYVEYKVGNMFNIKKLNIQLFNISGQKVLERESPYSNGKLNINGLSGGNYVLIINSPDGKYRHTQKIIKR